MEPKGDIALIGLAVMGQNLILNMNDHGFTVVAYNRTVSKVDDFINGAAKGTNIIDLCQRGFNCFLGPLGATFMLGMFSRRVCPIHMVPAFVLGEVVGVSTSYSMQFFGVPFSTHLIVPAAWAATMIAALLLSLLIPRRPSTEQLRWTRRGVLADEHLAAGESGGMTASETASE